jgi:hypothetical protein
MSTDYQISLDRAINGLDIGMIGLDRARTDLDRDIIG